MNCSNGAYSGRTLLPWNLVKGSSYNATAVLSKIRCIIDKHQMQSKYVTWYGHHHLVLLISISKASLWYPSSPAQHLDLHRCVVVVSPTIALWLLLTHNNKVKQLHGVCISYNKETTIRLLPVADRLQNMIISYNNIYHIMSWPYHITTCPAKTS